MKPPNGWWPRKARIDWHAGCHRGRALPSPYIDYKKNRIKQYFKEGRALRTETVINEPWDFRIGRLLKNLPRLRELGFAANRRLLDVQHISQDCTIGEAVFQRAFANFEGAMSEYANRVNADPKT